MNLYVHALIAIVLVAGYVVLTALGHDGNALLAILAGQAGAKTIDAVTPAKTP